jgi:hypothetical protein
MFFRPAEIHRQNVEECVEVAVNEGKVRKWCWVCKEGTTEMLDEERSGFPCLVLNDQKNM